MLHDQQKKTTIIFTSRTRVLWTKKSNIFKLDRSKNFLFPKVPWVEGIINPKFQLCSFKTVGVYPGHTYRKTDKPVRCANYSKMSETEKWFREIAEWRSGSVLGP